MLKKSTNIWYADFLTLDEALYYGRGTWQSASKNLYSSRSFNIIIFSCTFTVRFQKNKSLRMCKISLAHISKA